MRMLKFIGIVLAFAIVTTVNYCRPEKITDQNIPLEIDFSAIVGKEKIRFIVPRANAPEYYSKEGFFTFNLVLDSEKIKNVYPTRDKYLRILVSAEKDNKHLRSVYTTRNALRDSNYIGQKYGFAVYEEYTGQYRDTKRTYYIKKDAKGFPIIIGQSDEINPRVYRAISENIELDYVFSKNLGIENWDEVDRSILEKIAEFYEPPNKLLKAQPSAAGTSPTGAASQHSAGGSAP